MPESIGAPLATIGAVRRVLLAACVLVPLWLLVAWALT